MLGALTAFAPISVDLYLPAFPAVASHFDTSVGSVQLSLSTYMVGLAAGQVLYGRLSDIHGRRRPLLAGVSLYVVASFACAFAPSVETLIGLRLLQGFGGCAGIVIARAIVRDLFTGADAARFFTLLMLVFGVAPIVAPLLGGQILPIAGWQGIFVTLGVYGAACLAAVLWLPETLPPERRRAGGFRDAVSSHRAILGNRAFLANTGAGSLAIAALIAYIASSPAVVIEQYGVSPQSFGFVFGANALGLVAVSQIVGLLVGRVGVETVLRRGLIVQAAASLVLLGVAVADVGGLFGLLVPLFVVVSSVGAILPTSTALALTPFPHAAGAAAGVIGTAQAGLGAIAGAVVSAIALEPSVTMAAVLAGAAVAALGVLLAVAPRRGLAPVSHAEKPR